ncbi:uncharacterized protein LOC142239889 [Haematobia irritans]|uniref:uncharacterized protein LOC142239889 n=1 Tax=Haematobia irritans TaxID=7368 RepID=UPI003F4F55F0
MVTRIELKRVMATKVKLTGIKCEVLDTKVGEFQKCFLKAIQRDVTEMNVYFRLNLKPLNNASLKLMFTKRGLGKQNTLYQYRINLCEFLRNSRRNPLADIFYKFFEFRKYSNMNHTCPYDKRQFKITNFKCQSFDDNFGYFQNCSLKAIKRDVSEVNLQFKLNTIIRNNLMIQLLLKNRRNVRNPAVYNITIDACKFLESRVRNPVANLMYIFLGLRDYSNMNHTCPYENEVYLREYRYNEKYINLLPIPLGQYSIDMVWKYYKKIVVKYDVSFEFFEKFDYGNSKKKQ